MAQLPEGDWAMGGGALLLLAVGVLAAIVLVVLVVRMVRRRPEVEEQAIRRNQTLRVVTVVVLLAIIAAFAIANVHLVAVSWVFAETTIPMVLVIVLSGFVGFLIGALVGSRRQPG